MIGKSLRERHTLGVLPEERAVAVLTSMLASQAAHLVEVRAQDPRMIACLVVRADEPSIRLCRALGFRVKRGGTGVFGLHGADLARLLPDVSAGDRAWLEAACGPRETKVLLVAGGTALLSLETNEGKVVITAAT
jgi:hypothetical protein